MSRLPNFQVYGDYRLNTLNSSKIVSDIQMILPHIPSAAAPPALPDSGAGIAYNDATDSVYYSTGTGAWLPIGGMPTIDKPDIFGAALTANQSIATATPTTLVGFTVTATPNATFGTFNAGTGTYTAVLAQKVEYTACISWQSGIAGGSRTLNIYHNAVLIANDVTDPDTSGVNPTTQSVTAAATLAIGDTLTVQVVQDSGIAQNVLGGAAQTNVSGVAVTI